MASRFACLQSDSDSEESVREVSPPRSKIGQAVVGRTNMQQVQPNLASYEDGGEFCAVPKKKAHSGKVSAEMVKKAADVTQTVHEMTAPTAAGNGSSEHRNKMSSPVSTSPRIDFHSIPQNPQVTSLAAPTIHTIKNTSSPGKKKKKIVNNMFACLDESEPEDEEEDEEIEEPLTVQKPVLPKHANFTNNSTIPEYLAVTHIESTQPSAEEQKNLSSFTGKKFKQEVVLFSVLFVNTKTKKTDFEFSHVVQPTDYPSLSKVTTELTGLTDEILLERKAQPLDEVMREFERFLKEKNLVSANRNKKRASSKFTQQEVEFVMVTSGPEVVNDGLRSEMTRKGIQPMNYLKKWVDVKKIFAELYNMQEDASLHEILDKICMEFEGSPHIDDARNIAKIVVCMLNDSPQSLVCNQVGK